MNRKMLFGRVTSRGSDAEHCSSSSSPTSSQNQQSAGLFIAPFRNRARMLTEETVLVHNVMHRANHDNVLDRMISEEVTAMGKLSLEDDESSTVSSLSNDSHRRYGLGDNENEAVAQTLPPQEIHITFRTTLPPPVKQFPQTKPTRIKPRSRIPPVWTGLSSPLLPRPKAPRNAASNTRQHSLFSATPQSAASKRRSFNLPSSITENSACQSISDSKAPSTTPTWASSDVALLGDRPKRRHRRVLSGAYSVGTLVGQSSLITDPTTICSSSSLSLSETSRQHNRRRAAGVKNELKFMLGRVASPILRLTKTDTNKPELNRAKGCLT
jgi:hypothetical protein